MPSHRLASPDITHQYLDGEVVAIDFVKGDYHSMRGAAGPAFDALAQGVEAERLADLFSGAPSEAPALLRELIAKWVELGLLAPAEASATAVPLPAPVEWATPFFETYTDMQQLLLADPIHDVGDGAWPRQAETPKP
jgi:hypothetical protein